MRLAYTRQEPTERFWKTKWDFFTGGCGSKAGNVTELSHTGCDLRTAEPIEFRRWIRLLIQDGRSNLTFTAVGRVTRCEDSFDASVGSDVTLYRYRVEFTYPVSTPQIIAATQASASEISDTA